MVVELSVCLEIIENQSHRGVVAGRTCPDRAHSWQNQTGMVHQATCNAKSATQGPSQPDESEARRVPEFVP